MKKILLILSLLLIQVIAFAQLELVTGYRLYLGVPGLYGNDWDDGHNCNVLISFSKSNAVVYSQEEQFYRVIEQTFTSDNQTKWLAKDDDGQNCYIILGYDPKVNSTYFMIEYSNLVICYFTKS
jgi:hypothetical protein